MRLLEIATMAFMLSTPNLAEATQKQAPEQPLPFKIMRASGTYKIGTRYFDFKSPARPKKNRVVPLQIWYPANPVGSEPLAPYNTKEAMAYIKQVTIEHHQVPESRLVHMMDATGNAYLNAPISQTESKYPIIIFSPGYLTPPQSYTALLEDLASHGYIVVGMSHAKFPPLEEELKMPMGDFHQIWEDNVSRLIRDLPHLGTQVPVLSKADIGKLGLVGHSFGGSTSLQVCEKEPLCKCAADIDGFLHAKHPVHKLHKPSLALMANDPMKNMTPADKEKDAALLKLFKSAKGVAPMEYIEIEKMNHFSFTDAWILLPHIAEKTATISGEKGIEVSRKILAWFFDKNLKGLTQEFPQVKNVELKKR